MTFTQKAKSFFIQCGRVWRVLRKPTMKEFSSVAKVSAIGIVVIGTIGFLVSVVMKSFI